MQIDQQSDRHDQQCIIRQRREKLRRHNSIKTAFQTESLYVGSLRQSTKETLIYWLHERITSLRGTRHPSYLVDMSMFLRSERLVLHLVRRISQRFPTIILFLTA